MSRKAPVKNKKNTYQDYVAAMANLGEAAKSGHFPAVILIHGPSDFLISKTLKVLRDHWQGHGEIQTLEATEVDESKLASLAGQSSLFDPSSLFIVKRLEQAKGAAKWLKTAKIPVDGSNHFCFVLQGTLLQGLRTEFTRLKTLEIPCVEPWPNELAPLVQAMARRAGLPLQPDALSLLMEAVGADLVKLENEITRLALIFAGNSTDGTLKPVTAVELAPLLGMLREDFVFELDNLLLQRHYAKAQALLTGLLLRGESALALLGILARHCRIALRVHAAQQAAGRTPNPRDLAFELHLPFNVAKSYTQYVARSNPRVFAEGLVLCQETDQKLKSSATSDELLLGMVIETLAAP